MQSVTYFKVVVAGYAGIGKTHTINRAIGIQPKGYYPTLGCDVQFLTFNTTKGAITLKIWDVGGGDESAQQSRYGYYPLTDALIVFIDNNKPRTIEYAKNVIRSCPHKSLIVCFEIENPITKSEFPESAKFCQIGLFKNPTYPFILALHDLVEEPFTIIESVPEKTPRLVSDNIIDITEFIRQDIIETAKNIQVDFTNSRIILEF